MTTTTITKTQSSAARRRYRLLTVVVGTVVSLAVWIAASLAGASLQVASPLVGTIHISAPLVVVSALPLALGAWGVLALLERLTPYARRNWTLVAVALLGLSLPPLALLDAPAGTKVALGIMHVATGLTLIVMLRRSARTS